MNLSEALDAALPEIPKARYARRGPPRLDPALIARDDVADGEPFVGVMNRARASYFRMVPEHWRLAQLFDGERSYDDIAELYLAQSGFTVTSDYLQDFVRTLEEAGLWYKTPQEKNLALSEKLAAQRSRRAGRKSKVNLAHISFSAWDPDTYLTWLDRRVGRFIYSPWCVLAVLLLFVFEATVFIANWKYLGPDIPLYFNFTQKNFSDIVEFWILLFALGFVHETAHGLTCKHYGGEVHSMGLMFLYLTPCFFADITEAWVSSSRVHRMAAIIAGIWIEMVVCGLAMIVWTNTPPGMWVHDFSYKVILITGLAVIVMNLNPLLKLDGYYFLTELITIPDLKEHSTAFVSGWFQRHVLGLPVEVPVVPRRRVALYTLYALASGFYSYFVLFAVIRLCYNITSHWLAEFALLPTGLLAFAMFKGRLISLRRTLARTLSPIWSLWTRQTGAPEAGVGLSLEGSSALATTTAGPPPRRTTARAMTRAVLAAAALFALVFAPLWRDRENAYFVIEPASSETVHASLPGRVEEVLVTEGQRVQRGQPLLRLSSAGASSMNSAARADSSSADFQAYAAELRGASIGPAAAARQAAERVTGMARSAQASLVAAAPVDGIVMTADPAALVNQSVASGEPLISLAIQGPRVARVFIPASVLSRIPANAETALLLPGDFSVLRLPPGALLPAIAPETVTLPEGIVPAQRYKGVTMPTFYSARIPLPANGVNPPIGTAGEAKIFGVRRSLAGRFFSVAANLFRAHVW